ncbi:MAG: 23S rRNA (guanosine(2251)-2'-O)-methyltransferase RlmB [Aquificaceae bacterium]|nr:23S rRNA (guanosine(2251)-2'-O)-methyltransferase RlmB [Aquificaceae bacterium]MDW8237709.1 23S rRNA (guanosine(2251)-2'-O)-methyltransferase RlmB [Aquificaceae bacterium]
MIIFGRNAIIEALRAGREFEKVFVAHDSAMPVEILRLCKERGIKLQRVSRKKVEELAGVKKTQGVVAILSEVDYVSSQELFDEVFKRDGFFLVLDHLSDPQNVGNLLRTCEAFGGVGALLPKDRACPINQTVVKASSGAIFHLRLSKVSNLHLALREFKKLGGWVFALDMQGKSLKEASLVLPCALIVGNEGQGVSKLLLELSDGIFSIPMSGKVESLNASSAGAIGMWELIRRAPPGGGAKQLGEGGGGSFSTNS